MSTCHREVLVQTRGRGTYEFTDALNDAVAQSNVEEGLLNVFCRHTSCSLVVMENADPSARRDLERFFDRLVPNGAPSYEHSLEGPDDMPAHIRMALTRTSETIPISKGTLLLGSWQGVFLFEHRTSPHRRKVVVSILA